MKMKAVAGNAKKQRGRRKRFLFPFPVPYFIFTYPDHVCCVQNAKIGTANSILRILLSLSSLKNRSIDLDPTQKTINTTYLPSNVASSFPDTSFALYSLLDVCFLNYADAIHGNYRERRMEKKRKKNEKES